MSIRPHPSHPGWYIVDHYPNGRNGKREREPFPTYEQASQFQDALKKREASPTGITHPRIEQISEEFLCWVKENQRPDTYGKRQQCLKRMLPTFGNYRIKDLTLSILRSYMSGKSKHTRYDELMTLLSLARWMTGQKYADIFPILPDQLKEFKRPDSKVRPTPDPGEVLNLIDNCKNDKIRIMLQLMVYTGLRWKEVRLLKWEDYRNGQFRIDSPKTDEAIVALPGILQEWFNQNRQAEGWVFVGYMGQPYYKIGHFFTKFKKETGIALSAHLLRHAGAIFLEEQTNGNIYAVNQFLRHKSLGTTATYLRKYSANKLRTSANSIVDYVVRPKNAE
jgi:integrase